MLHEARMNFQRTIVNQAPRFPCRGAAQFNLRLRLTLAEENHRWTPVLRSSTAEGGQMNTDSARRAPSSGAFTPSRCVATEISPQGTEV